MSCIFCKIAMGKIPSNAILEDEKSFAFLDINPLTEGHTVVIPKGHVANITELPDGDVDSVFSTVKKVVGMLEGSLGVEDFTIGINHGRIGGQTVDHLHIHIIPRYKGDGGGSMHSVVNKPPKETLEETKKKILSFS